jgi:hypothetical protein
MALMRRSRSRKSKKPGGAAPRRNSKSSIKREELNMGSEEQASQGNRTQEAIEQAEKAVAEAVKNVIQQQEAAVEGTVQSVAAGIQAAKSEIDASIQAAENAVQDAIATTQKTIQQIVEAAKQGPPPPGVQQ